MKVLVATVMMAMGRGVLISMPTSPPTQQQQVNCHLTHSTVPLVNVIAVEVQHRLLGIFCQTIILIRGSWKGENLQTHIFKMIMCPVRKNHCESDKYR